MNIKILKWYLIAVIIIALCFILIPETEYQSLGWSIGIVTSLLAAFFVFLAISEIESISDLMYFSENPKSQELMPFLIPIATLIIGTAFINVNFSNRLEKKIKKEGVLAIATIDSGFSKTTQSSRGSYSDNTLALTLVTEDDKEYKLIADDISSETYRKVGVGLDVEIIYLPQNPKIFRVLVDDASVKKFKNIANRAIEFNDLEKIITAKEPENLKKMLDKLSNGWQKHQTEEEGFGFINNIQKEIVFVNPEKRMLFYVHEIPYSDKKFDLPKDRVLKELSDSTSVSYEMDKYYVQQITKFKKGDQMAFVTVEDIIMRVK